jgi:hypothetical protein
LTGPSPESRRLGCMDRSGQAHTLRRSAQASSHAIRSSVVACSAKSLVMFGGQPGSARCQGGDGGRGSGGQGGIDSAGLGWGKARAWRRRGRGASQAIAPATPSREMRTEPSSPPPATTASCAHIRAQRLTLRLPASPRNGMPQRRLRRLRRLRDATVAKAASRHIGGRPPRPRTGGGSETCSVLRACL